MDKHLLLAVFTCFFSSVFAQVPAGYYDDAEGLTGNDLKNALNDIIDFHVEFPYSSSNTDTWDILKQADVDPNNSSNVLGIYSEFSMNAAQEYNSGNGWNREHVWARSRGDFDTQEGVGTDAHNLRAADISTNSARSNRNFDEATSQYIDNGGSYTGTTNAYLNDLDWTWEPPDAVKGDIARTIFYMATRYEGERSKDPDLELTENLQGLTDKAPLHAKLSVLIQWHTDDPVTTAERNRNDVIYTFQGNRNPFVDRPEFVDRIWGSQLILPLDLLYFKGELNGHLAQLNWKTANEENVSHFDIEISSDGQNFSKIEAIPFQASKADYGTEYPIDADAYFRLKIVDFDGKTAYSNIIHIAMKAKAPEVIVVANQYVQLVDQAREVQLTISDINGRIVERMVLPNADFRYDLSPLNPGIYIFQYVTGTTEVNRRVVKSN